MSEWLTKVSTRHQVHIIHAQEQTQINYFRKMQEQLSYKEQALNASYSPAGGRMLPWRWRLSVFGPFWDFFCSAFVFIALHKTYMSHIINCHQNLLHWSLSLLCHKTIFKYCTQRNKTSLSQSVGKQNLKKNHDLHLLINGINFNTWNTHIKVSSVRKQISRPWLE